MKDLDSWYLSCYFFFDIPSRFSLRMWKVFEPTGKHELRKLGA